MTRVPTEGLLGLQDKYSAFMSRRPIGGDIQKTYRMTSIFGGSREYPSMSKVPTGGLLGSQAQLRIFYAQEI